MVGGVNDCEVHTIHSLTQHPVPCPFPPPPARSTFSHPPLTVLR